MDSDFMDSFLGFFLSLFLLFISNIVKGSDSILKYWLQIHLGLWLLKKFLEGSFLALEMHGDCASHQVVGV